MLSSHGCFSDYLAHIGAVNDAMYADCGTDVDTAMHTLAECPASEPQREVLKSTIGSDLSYKTIISAMLKDEETCMAFMEEGK